MDIITLSIIFLIGIGFIIVSTSKWHLHPFLALLIAAYGIGFASGLKPLEIAGHINAGFGGILSYIGLVILLGTLIGVCLQKSGAAITMADVILKAIGKKHPALAMSLIGYLVSISVFCDSAFVILNSLKRSIIRQKKVSAVAMTTALSTGLFASHAFIPPTPGPIAAAANLEASNLLGMVILYGLGIGLFAVLIGFFWARFVEGKFQTPEDIHDDNEDFDTGIDRSKLPSALAAFTPVLLPIILIGAGSVANMPNYEIINSQFNDFVKFLGTPLNALFIGLICCIPLMPKLNKETMTGWINEGLVSAGLIIMITGAGGSLGKILQNTPMAELIGQSLGSYSLGVFLPFIIAAALKTAQGSSTVALVTTSSILFPLLAQLGLDSDTGKVLAVMAMGAGAMTISHANDSYFWVVAQFSKMDVKTAYYTHSLATLLQGVCTFILIFILSLFLL